MEQYVIYAQNVSEERFQQLLQEAKQIANIIQNTVYIYISCCIVEVKKDEKKEKEVKHY